MRTAILASCLLLASFAASDALADMICQDLGNGQVYCKEIKPPPQKHRCTTAQQLSGDPNCWHYGDPPLPAEPTEEPAPIHWQPGTDPWCSVSPSHC